MTGSKIFEAEYSSTSLGIMQSGFIIFPYSSCCCTPAEIFNDNKAQYLGCYIHKSEALKLFGSYPDDRGAIQSIALPKNLDTSGEAYIEVLFDTIKLSVARWTGTAYEDIEFKITF